MTHPPTPEAPEREEAAPCPFHDWASPLEIVEGGYGFYVECMTCGGNGPCLPTRVEAVAAWNRRAPLAPAAAPGWRVKPLAWEADENGNLFCVSQFGAYGAYVLAEGGARWHGPVVGTRKADTLDAAKAAAQADYDARVRACLEPAPEPRAVEAARALAQRMTARAVELRQQEPHGQKHVVANEILFWRDALRAALGAQP